MVTQSGGAKAVPVLMMHSVAPVEALAPFGWLQNLATPPELLEASFELWKRKGYSTLTLEALSDHMTGKRPAPKRSLVLTLDDGYLDNWVALHPLLRAYGFHAVVFASTDFIDARPVKRPQMSAATEPSGLEWKGYLSWEEMRAMESDGSVEIQSHARTHTWYFISDLIVDYYRPGNALTKSNSMLRFLWLNEHPGSKPFALREMKDESVPWGTPVYEYRPSLVARRFYPDPQEAQAATAFVAERGGARFFESRDWRRLLDEEVAEFRSGRRAAGVRETEDEYRARVFYELEGSRRQLSENLGKDVHTLCYPQGAMDDTVESLARQAGYRMWTMSSWRRARANRRTEPQGRIYRCGRGYNLFGERRSVRLQLLSQQVVLARFSGSAWAHLATGLISHGRRFLPRAG